MPARLLLDLTHTSHTRALTGIQRVARGLGAELGDRAAAVCHDPWQRAWRTLEDWESANLEAQPDGQSRRARWPLAARIRGVLRRRRPSALRLSDFGGGFLTPEIFSPATAAALPPLLAAVPGPAAALFYDAIALKLPELSPPSIVARYPGYLQELLAFDGVAAISADARDALLEYWEWLGVARHPEVAAIPLGLPRAAIAPETDRPDERMPPAPSETGLPVVLSVGSLEGRKNHLALLEACGRLWAGGLRFELRLIGAGRPETARAALDRIQDLRRAGRPIRHDGAVDDRSLEAAYRQCAFTVYPSLMEGFGLPVIESLARGKPCICSAAGALGESARDGGCLALESVDAISLGDALARLLKDPALLAALSAEARSRTFKTAADHAREIVSWMASLK